MQDFSKKITIVVQNGIEPWRVLNTVAHASAYLGNKIAREFGTGEYFVTKDGKNHPRNTQYAVVVLSAEKGDLLPLLQKAQELNMVHIGFSRDMTETTDDAELEGLYALKNEDEIDLLGVGLFGDRELLKELTGKFKLWK